jgi:hypothetical protein
MSIRDTYKAEITLDVQQLFELQKAIADRTVKLVFATDEEYPYRSEDIETLLSVTRLLDPHYEYIVETHEGEVASKEAAILENDEEIQRFMEG